MRNIGKALLFIFLLISSLQAGITAYVDAKSVQAGDNVTLTIESDEENTIFPTISKIGDYPVLSSPSSRSIQNINGKVTARLSQSYVFQPTKDVTIPSFEVRLKGAVVKTDPIAISVSKRTQTLNQPYRFDIAIDKSDPYVGEEVTLTATLTLDSRYSLEGLDLFFDRLDGFQVSSRDKNWRGNRAGDKIIFKRTFYLYPEYPGKIEIPNYPIVGIMSDGRNRIFFNESKKFVAYSNSLNLDVKPLPGGAQLVGKFSLSVKTDRFKTKIGEPVNLTITVAGEGSLDGFEGFDLKLDGVTTYADNPKFEQKRKNGVLNSSVVYKYALVSDRNYTIPSFAIQALDPKNGKVKRSASNPVDIEVEGAKEKEKVVIEGAKKAGRGEDTPEEAGGSTLPFALGLIVGLVIGLILPQLRQGILRKKMHSVSQTTLMHRVKNSKDAKTLLGHIIHYVGDAMLHDYIVQLEKGLSGPEFKQLKKEIVKRLEEKGEK